MVKKRRASAAASSDSVQRALRAKTGSGGGGIGVSDGCASFHEQRVVKLRAFPHILCVLHQLSTDATVLVGALCRSSADGCCTVELPVGQVGSSRSTATQCASNNNNSSLRKALFLANC